jgi:hypothetical protein
MMKRNRTHYNQTYDNYCLNFEFYGRREDMVSIDHFFGHAEGI